MENYKNDINVVIEEITQEYEDRKKYPNEIFYKGDIIKFKSKSGDILEGEIIRIKYDNTKSKDLLVEVWDSVEVEYTNHLIKKDQIIK